MQYVSNVLNVLLFYVLFDYIVKTVIILTVIIVMVKVLSTMSLNTPSKESSVMAETPTIDNTEPTIDNTEPTDDTTPSVFINEELLKISSVASVENGNNFRRFYKIQDMTFADEYKPNYDGFKPSYDKLVEFALEEVDSGTNRDNNCITDDKKILITCQRIKKGFSGYLINSNVHLSTSQWHTIVHLSNDLSNCIVCDVYFEAVSMEEHINTKAHTNQLSKYKPLIRFDFSITRKINEFTFHCAVCNLVITVSEKDHLINVNHQNHLRVAVNRAFECLYDTDDSNDDHDRSSLDDCSVENDYSDVKDDDSVENDDWGIENGDFDDQSDDFNVDHKDSNIPPVVLLKYVKDKDTCRGNIDNSKATGMVNKRSNVIQLTSSVTQDESPIDHKKLGIKDHIINQLGISKHGYSNDAKIESFQNEAHSGVAKTLNEPKPYMKSFENRIKTPIVAKNDYVYCTNNRNMDENIQIMIKKTHFVIDLFAFNTIVFYGDMKYCFLCNTMASNDKIIGHVKSGLHKDNLLKHSFLENYSKHLIRQNNFKYHCGICNVVINHTHLTNHVEWATHQKLSIQCKTKKSLRKSTKVINVATQREDKVSNVNAPKLKILFHVQIVATPQMTPVIDKIENKTLKLNGVFFNIDFYNWNGLCKSEKGFRCLICEENLTENVEMHCKDRHNDSILNNIDSKYCPALIRKLSDKYVHCIACNKLLYTEVGVISSHLEVMKHQKNHMKLLNK